MRPLATIRRRPAGALDRGRFHTAALLVLFAALAWISEAWQDRPQPRDAEPVRALQEGCRPQSDRAPRSAVELGPDNRCRVMPAGRQAG